MLFHVLGIKEIGWKNYNLDFVVQDVSEQALKEFLGTLGVVVVTIAEYTETPESFGDTKLIIKNVNDEEDFVILKTSDYRKAYLLASMVGLEVLDVIPLHDTENPVTPEQMQKNIAERKQQLEKLHEIDHSKKFEVQKHDFDLEDHRTTEMQLLASQVIQRSNMISTTMADEISPQEKKDLETLTQELAKIKLGTNLEKMRQHTNEIIIIIDELEKRKMHKLENFQKKIFKDSIVTDIDIAKEVQKYEKAKDIQQVWGVQNASDKFYTSLGKPWVCLKLVWKDFLHKLSKHEQVTLSVFRFIYSVLIITTLILGLYLVVYAKRWDSIQNTGLVLSLIKWAVLSGLFVLTDQIAKKRYQYLIMGIIISIPIYFLIILILKNTLSL